MWFLFVFQTFSMAFFSQYYFKLNFESSEKPETIYIENIWLAIVLFYHRNCQAQCIQIIQSQWKSFFKIGKVKIVWLMLIWISSCVYPTVSSAIMIDNHHYSAIKIYIQWNLNRGSSCCYFFFIFLFTVQMAML